jgi:hypothetical protein
MSLNVTNKIENKKICVINSRIACQHCDFHVFHILHIRWHGFYNIINVWLSHYSILKYQYDLLVVELTCVKYSFQWRHNRTLNHINALYTSFRNIFVYFNVLSLNAIRWRYNVFIGLYRFQNVISRPFQLPYDIFHWVSNINFTQVES